MPEFSYIMASLPAEFYEELNKIRDSIPKSSIIDIEDYYHTTLLYGIHSKDVDQIVDVAKKILHVLPNLSGKFGKITKFPEGKNGYPIKFDVISESFKAFNYLLRANLEYTNKFEYSPHVTLAYVDGSEKLSLKNTLHNKEFNISEIRVSLPDKSYITLDV